MKYLLKTFGFLAFLIGIVTPAWNQSSKITWYEKTNLGSEIISMQTPIKDGDYWYTAVNLFGTEGKFHMLKIDHDGLVDKQELIDEDKKGHGVHLQYLSQSDGKIYGYYESESNDSTTMYRDEVDKESLTFAGKEIIIDSGKKGNHQPGGWTMHNSIFGKELRIESKYFNKGYYNIQYNPYLQYHIILKLEPSEGKSIPLVKAFVYNDKLQLLNKAVFHLPGSNVSTQLVDAQVDQIGNIYLISASYEDKVPIFSLSVGKVNQNTTDQIKIPTNGHLVSIHATSTPTGLAMICLQGSDRKDIVFDLCLIFYNSSSNSLGELKTLVKDVLDGDDKIYCLSGNKSFLFSTQKFSDSQAYSSASGVKFSDRFAGDITSYNMDYDGNLLWKKTIKNAVDTPGGGNLYDGLLLFAFQDHYYLLYNIHPDNPGLEAKGAKLKTGYFGGKENLATEIVRFDDDGKINRKIIYIEENKIVTIPTLSRFVADNTFLVVGDIAKVGNSFHFGKFIIGDKVKN